MRLDEILSPLHFIEILFRANGLLRMADIARPRVPITSNIGDRHFVEWLRLRRSAQYRRHSKISVPPAYRWKPRACLLRGIRRASTGYNVLKWGLQRKD